MEDRSIIELYWQRSEEAIRYSELQYGAYCRSIALAILSSPEDAEECVSDTWLRSWNAMPPQKPSCLSAFFGKITRNLSLDRWRQSRTARRGGGSVTLALEDLRDCVSSKSTAEEELQLKDIAKCVSKFLRSQNELNRYLFIRRYWYLDELTDIAEITKLTPRQIRTRLYRMRAQLKNILIKDGIFI